jgi:glycosyltransferase involved in cell wall biosynthesis
MILKPIAKTHSVIVPCKGHYEYIIPCLESLRGQWSSLDQIIIVVDGDTKSLGIVKRYISELRGVKTSYHLAYINESSGAYAARNIGLSMSSSDCVSSCDADDMWAPNRSGDVLKCITDYKSIVNTYHCLINEEGKRIKRSIHPHGGSYSYHKKMIEKLGMFRQWPCSADSDMFYRAKALGGRLQMYRSYSYLYRQHGDQLTHREETKFGSETRAKYESMWHDGVTHHVEALAEHEVILNG